MLKNQAESHLIDFFAKPQINVFRNQTEADLISFSDVGDLRPAALFSSPADYFLIYLVMVVVRTLITVVMVMMVVVMVVIVMVMVSHTHLVPKCKGQPSPETSPTP